MDFIRSKKTDSEKDRRMMHLESEIRRLKSAVEELTVLNELAIAASTSMEVNQMLDIIVEKSIKTVKAEQGSILLVTDQTDSPLRTLIRQADRESRPMTYKVGFNITGWVLKNQQPLIIEDLASDKRFPMSEQERQAIRSVVCVPIQFKSELLGVLTVTNKKTPEPFNANDLRLLSIIAAQSGQLIRNSQLQQEAIEKKRMENELAMARRIQLGLLPKTDPKIENLDIFSYFCPADCVSGDYYDYFHLGKNRIGIVIADVSGHGPSAALVMTMVKGILHAISQNVQSPSRLLSEINSTLNEIIPQDMFVTMMFLVFDMEKKLLLISNAGHNPLLFFNNQSKSVQMVECQGTILGFSKEIVFTEKEISLNPGDLFLTYTDGITEAFNDEGQMFGEPRLIQAVEEAATQKTESIIENIRKQLRQFTNQTPQGDDIAMVVMKVL